jgi:hypothetical protein
MGLIEKSIRSRSNQKLAAEVFTQTTLSFDEVVRVVQAHCNASNEKVSQSYADLRENRKTRLGKWTASISTPEHFHYYVSPHAESRQILVGFAQQPEPILAGRPNTSRGVWAARISYPAGGNTVGIVLLKWTSGGSDGVLKNRGFYENLLEQVGAAIRADGSAVPSAPLQPEPSVVQTGPTEAPAGPLSAPGAGLTDKIRVDIGHWADDLHTQFPFLTRNEILGLAGMRALLNVDTGFNSSTYITQGTHGPAAYQNASTHSLLRSNLIRHSGASILTCGALSPDREFVEDWTFQCTVADDGAALVELRNARKNGAVIRSAELLARLKQAVATSMATGINLCVADGPPNLDGLVVAAPAETARYPDLDRSPFAGDHLGGLTGSYREPLVLPSRARNAVLTAMGATHFLSYAGQDVVLGLVSLAGGRTFDAGRVVLLQRADGDHLVIDLPAGLSPGEAERSFRAALKFLGELAKGLQEAEPDISAAVTTHKQAIAVGTQEARSAAAVARTKDRPEDLWLDYWSRTIAAPMVPVEAGRWYPVGIYVTAAAPADYVLKAMQAADWVTTLKRLDLAGTTSKGAARRVFSARRCGLLRNANDQSVPFFRYAWNPDLRDEVTGFIGPKQAWFWEAGAGTRVAGDVDDGNGGLLLVTGWSHADQMLSYGENLFSLLRAFAEVVSVTGNQPRIQTLYLQI